MSKIGKIARRTFLIGSAAIVGGVAFGYYAYKKPVANPLLKGLADGETALTAYVKIDADGITLITPRADSGQGAYSVQAIMIAEELDVELDQIKVDPGVPSRAYYNTALAQEAAPFPSTNDSFTANSMRGVMDAMMKFLGMDITGGSTTVPDGFTKLRVAGAVARETLKAAAAQKTGVALTDLRTSKGAVVLPDGTSLPYTELAAIAGTLDPVDEVQLRDPSTWRLMGKTTQRLDIVPKSTGTQDYGIDFTLDGMVHATVRTNPRRGGAMQKFDASDAKAMRGVSQVFEISTGVAVIADNTWRAIQAASAIEIEWDAAPYPAEMEDHWQTLSDSFVADRVDSTMKDEGDVQAALDTGDVIEAEYRAPYLAHAPLEPLSATVLVQDNRADVWTGTQIPSFLRGNVADITGLDKDDVHIHMLMMGGSFGHRLEARVVQEAAEIAVKMKGTPVKLTYSREEDMTHNDTRQIAMARGRGTVKNGQVESFDLGIAMPSVIASQMGRQGISVPGPDTQIVAGAWEQPMRIPNYRVTGYRAPELAPISSWRSVGASSNGFFHDVFLDELIHAAGADPMAERLRLCWHDPSRKVLEKVADMSNWGAPLAANQGRGVAFCMSFGVPTAEVVEVTATEDGIRLDNVWVAADVGTVVDPVNFENMVQGGVVWGLGHAILSEITYSDGMVEQDNYDSFEAMRMYQVPNIEVAGLENADQVRGMGEPMVPPAAAALSNAIFAATGQRIREMPMNKFIDFV
ncbi:Isoquinoline 1-oxidoreductase subunit beta [Ascidiaceihabitans donghaensis]|uniref:Isoquinoline 1-oxidoreductase subunit beta n=1 Tax=Ascidiaceihabitans donghaensis TaxID=1510460 RepID=A0A2R8BGC9_9RHOB|nr:molybdopterin cofactor-binding domain-containing protein [Ascidiaceihabitans donghaensis]SPH22182.1 Isoquinoline 1-oxidoreductase subunit beta [Ascidiaceihabitans donghaensis]